MPPSCVISPELPCPLATMLVSTAVPFYNGEAYELVYQLHSVPVTISRVQVTK